MDTSCNNTAYGFQFLLQIAFLFKRQLVFAFIDSWQVPARFLVGLKISMEKQKLEQPVLFPNDKQKQLLILKKL